VEWWSHGGGEGGRFVVSPPSRNDPLGRIRSTGDRSGCYYNDGESGRPPAGAENIDLIIVEDVTMSWWPSTGGSRQSAKGFRS
jgi:hypothetical protein